MPTERFYRLSKEKADKIVFTSSTLVTNAIGNFIVGEDLQGLTIAELFAKLLGLSNEPGQEPGVPSEPKNLVESIVVNETPMYGISSDGALVEIPFKLVDANAVPSESGFYVIKDSEGTIIEAGYQELSAKNEDMYYMIALPSEIDFNTMVEVQTWDPYDQMWVKSELALTSDPNVVNSLLSEVGLDSSHIGTDNYTIWALEDACTGSIIRFTIKEEV